MYRDFIGNLEMLELIQKMASTNFVLTWCLIIGFSDFIIMWGMSVQGENKSQYQIEYRDMYEPVFQSIPYRILRFLLLGY